MDWHGHNDRGLAVANSLAAYAAGGMKALADLRAKHSAGASKLIEQLK